MGSGLDEAAPAASRGWECADGVKFHAPFAPRSKPNNPTMAAPVPPISNQTALSVGDPVKKRDTSELNEVHRAHTPDEEQYPDDQQCN